MEEFPRNRQYDLVSMIQVLPHFVDPRGALEAASDVLRECGLCLIETWNRASWTARLLGRHWHEYGPPSVLHWFSADRVRCLMAELGFCQIACGRPEKRLNGQHAKSLLAHKLRGRWVAPVVGKLLAVVPSRLSIPYPAEDLFWALFQKTGIQKKKAPIPCGSELRQESATRRGTSKLQEESLGQAW
jgi:hypothetical protein